MLNHIQAQSEIKSHFYTKFQEGLTVGFPDESPAIPPLSLTKANGDAYSPVIEWQNVQQATYSDVGEHWLRFTTQNLIRRQTSLTGGRAEAVGTKFTTRGIIVVQLFFSKSAYQTTDAETLSFIVERALTKASTPGGVWFRNATIRELDPEENFFRTNVTAEYEYDSIVT